MYNKYNYVVMGQFKIQGFFRTFLWQLNIPQNSIFDSVIQFQNSIISSTLHSECIKIEFVHANFAM